MDRNPAPGRTPLRTRLGILVGAAIFASAAIASASSDEPDPISAQGETPPETAPAEPRSEPTSSAPTSSAPTSSAPTSSAPTSSPVAPADDEAAGAPVAGAGQAALGGPTTPIRFNFKQQSYDQILDYFSRVTGYPIVRETEVPQGLVDYLYPGEYTLNEALRTLNILLQTQGCMLRVDGERIFLQKLDDMKRENVPTFVGTVPAEVPDEAVVTVLIPLLNARAAPVAEQLKNLVASYGSVTALEQQNALVLVETAAQVRRLQKILGEIDQQDVENVVELLPLRYAKAPVLLKSLTALMGERVVEYVINPQDQKRIKLEENRVAGLTMAADERTNSIVARGSRAKLDQVKATIALLDVPAAEGLEALASSRSVRTIELHQRSVSEAKAALEQLYAPIPQKERPAVIAFEDTNRIAIVGDAGSVAEGQQVLRDLEGSGAPVGAESTRNVTVIQLSSAQPDAIVSAVQALLNERQRKSVTLLPGPDSKSVLVHAVPADTETVRAIVTMLDLPERREQSVRILRLPNDADARTVARARELFEAEIPENDPRRSLRAELDESERTLTLVGPTAAVAQFAELLDQLGHMKAHSRETREIALRHAMPSEVGPQITALARTMLDPRDGTQFVAPDVQPIDALKLLVVSAAPKQFETIERLAASLDRVAPGDHQFRAIDVDAADPAALLEKAKAAFERRAAGATDGALPFPRVEFDGDARRVLVSGDPQSVALYERAFDEARQLVAPARTISLVQLQRARAESVVDALNELLERAGSTVRHLGAEPPRVEPFFPTNSVLVEGEPAQIALVERTIAELDRVATAPNPDLRVFRLECADPASVVRSLQDLAARGALSAPAGPGVPAVPVSISFEPTARTLLVAGDAATFERVESILRELAVSADPSDVRLVTLQKARAADVRAALADLPAATFAGDGVTPRIESVDSANALVVAATPRQHDVLAALIRSLDVDAANASPLRVLQLRTTDAATLATALSERYGERPAAERATRPVSITADPATNTLLVAAHPDAFREIEELVGSLNSWEPSDRSAREIRVVPLKVARADELARLLDGMFPPPPAPTDARGRSRPDLATPREVIVRADAQTNSLVLDAVPGRLASLERLIDELDRESAIAATEIHTYRLVAANPGAVATTLTQLAQQGQLGGLTADGRPRTTVSVEPVSRTLVVSGPREAFAKVDDVLKGIDPLGASDDEAAAPVLSSFTLVATRAETVAPLLREVIAARLRVDAGAGDLERTLTVTADPRTNSIFVAAPKRFVPGVEELVKRLDVATSAAQSDTRVFTLVSADPSDAVRALQSAADARAKRLPAEPPPSVAPAPSAGAVVATGTPDQLAEFEKILSSLDRGVRADSAQVRTIPLKHARAEGVAPIIERLLSAPGAIDPMDLPEWGRVEWLRQRRMAQANGADAELPVRVAADSRLNAVVVSAPRSVLDVAEAMVAQLDQPAGAVGGRSVRVLPVANADAAGLVASVQGLFEDEGAGAPLVRANESGNALVVRATDEQFAAIERVVHELDAATFAGGRQLRSIPIDPARADAAEVARLLERMLERGGSKVEVVPLEELLRRHAPTTQVVPAPANARSDARESRAGSLPALIVGSTFGAVEDAPGDTDDASDVTIAVDKATNSLILLGSPAAVERLRALAEQAQQALPGAATGMHRVPLPNSIDVERLRGLVAQTLASVAPAGGKPGELAHRVAVLADESSNSLIVSASERDFEIVGQLIATFADAAAPERLSVKVYPLANVSADRAARGLREILGAGRTDGRYRDLAVSFDANGTRVEANFDPGRVRAVADAASNSLTVIAPAEAIGFVDGFVALAEQRADTGASAVRLVSLHHARASLLATTLASAFRQSVGDGAKPEFAADDRTNTLLVTAPAERFGEIEALVARLDIDETAERHALTVVSLASADPQLAADLLNKAVIGNDERRRAATLIVPDAISGSLFVRADDATLSEIKSAVAEIDRSAVREFPVRSIVLERADAGAVAQALQRFYDDRARIATGSRTRRDSTRRVAIVGDPRSATLLVAASDTDYEEVKSLVAQFDSPQATQSLEFRVYPLRHARARPVADSIQSILSEIRWSSNDYLFGGWGWGWGGNQRTQSREDRDAVAVRADERLNAVIATGRGSGFAVVEQLVEELDAPVKEGQRRTVRAIAVRAGDLDAIASLVRDAMGNRSDRWGYVSEAVRVVPVPNARVLLVSATEAQADEIATLVAGLEGSFAGPERSTEVVPVEFAQAEELADSLTRFLRDRAAAGGQSSPATIIASRSSNALVVSASADDLATIRDLVSQLDKPTSAGERSVEIVTLERGEANEIARLVGEQFGRRAGNGATGVIVTADSRTNALLVNAPPAQLGAVKALIARLDAPSSSDATIIRTYALKSAKADEVVRILAQTLQLDSRGRTAEGGVNVKLDESSPPVEIVARVTPDRRSNSVVVAATAESFPVIEGLLAKLEEIPAASPIEYRVLPLTNVAAPDVAGTLRRLIAERRGDGVDPPPTIDSSRLENQLIVGATADQFRTIEGILKAIDVPASRQRVTDFVALKFAEAIKVQDALSYFYGQWAAEADTPAKRTVRIVADPATNSLVISADEAEWPGIRELLAKLDNEEYDASLQLAVLPLLHADARSVAAAINEAFRGPIEQQRRQRDARDARGNRDNGDRSREDAPAAPTVLVQSDEWVSAAAEEQTNSVVVSANRQTMAKIESIVQQLDVADFDRLPAPRIIPIKVGNPEQLADAIDRIYAPPGQATRDARTSRLRIVADVTSNSLIVRGSEDEYRQILAIAEALQQRASEEGLTVELLPLKTASATRVASAIRDAFAARAAQAKLPLAVQADPTGNALVVASTGPMHAEIRRVVEEMEKLSPTAGQAIFVIDLQHVAPEAAKRVIEEIGLDQPTPDNTSSRVLVEPVKVSVVPGRAAIVVVGNPTDRETIVALVKALDSEPAAAEAMVRIIPLRNAQAGALAEVLSRMLEPGASDSDNALARALQEQVRRLSLRRDGANEPDLSFDLTKPVRILADERTNSLIVASVESNVRAIAEVIKTFDAVQVTDAVTVQIFPLENIAASQFARVVRELFTQGKKLGQVPGTDLTGVPAGTAGRALLAEISISTDDRTNTVVVAGPEDAVALVEVLKQKLDREIGIGWVESRVIPLRYADAEKLGALLQAIVVEGQRDLPESGPLQKQVGRLRAARVGSPDGSGAAVIESDVFVPLGQVVIRAEPQLNALVVVATQSNLEVVHELIRELDVEAASPAALVRVYPLTNASASRLAPQIVQLFEQQRQAGSIRSEDRLTAITDERTNSLIVSTSPRSFIVFEELLKTLDQKLAPEIREIRTFELERASAARIAPLVQSLMDARLERLRKVQPETADLERATVVADPRGNALVVAAGADTFSVIERLVKDLDRELDRDQSLLEAVPLKRANLERVANALNQIFERRYSELPDDVRRRAQPLVLTDPRTSSLLVSAVPEDLKSIQDLVAKLEAAPSNPAVGVEVIPLESARAEELAPRLQTLMRERLQSLGQEQQPSDSVAVSADTTSNSLIVAASPENVAVVRNLIDVLTNAARTSIGGQSFEIVQLARSRASDIVSMLDEMYVREENRRRGADSVRAAAEPRLNAVLVSGSAPDIDTLRRMIAQLDGAKPSSVVEIRYIPLASANVIETVNLIQTVLSGSSLAGNRDPQQAIVLKYLRQLGGQEGEGPMELEVSAAVRQSISLTPDVRTNTLIVRAPRESVELIERMVKDLDGSALGAQNIRVFRLVNADADQMATILKELFSLEQRGNLYVLKPREEPRGGDIGAPGAVPQAPSGIGLFGTELTMVPDERQQLSITIDSRTNSLLVSGTPNYLDLVDKVVRELDAQEANTRDTFVYRLKNAEALEVARVLTDFVQKDQQKVLATLSADQRPSAQKLLEQEVTVVGDEKSNSVLVNASPRYMERVRGVIRELDVDPPQVLIQVLLAEVTLDTSEELGLQFTRFSIGDVNVAGGFGLARSNFSSGISIPGLIGLAPALFGAASVPNIAIGNPDFDLLLNALASQNRVELLSNPSVMVANNTEGRIQVGDTVRLPTSVSFSSAGQQSSVEPEEVGVILTVTPSINPEGFVRMKIVPEISRISSDTTQISENFESPIINRRRATTTVTVKDGQTVVIGGLIQDRFERIERKIPLLGDIPLVGLLFRNKSESTSKTELLIVLTPHVVTTPEQMDELSQQSLGKSTLPPDLMEQLLRGELEGVRGTIDESGHLIHPLKKPDETQTGDGAQPSGNGAPSGSGG